MAHHIVKLIPDHQMYVEPFFGGGAVMFAKGLPEVSSDTYYHEIINDKDKMLINFYRQFQTNFGELFQRIAFTPHSEAEYRRAKEIMKEPQSHSDLELAWAYYVNIQQSFASKLNGGWQRIRKTPDKNEGAAWTNKTARLEELFYRFKKVTISCTDALTVIQQRDSETAFFYCDPPYPNVDQGHYSGYSTKDFQELIDLLATIKGKFILSNYAQPENTFPDSWIRKDIEAFSSAARKIEARGKRTEVLWMNFNPEIQPNLL
jgi:DNA adenine methylase